MQNSAQLTTKNNSILAIVALASGALLPFAFAPYNLYVLAIISPSLLLYTWLSATPKQAFWRGFIFGISFFSIAMYWVFISIHYFGDTPSSIAFIITAGLILILASIIGFNGLLFKWLLPTTNSLMLTLGFATTWVLMEWLRGWIFTGVPWVFLGYSQIDSALAGLAPIFSVYGVSFACAVSAGLIINSLRSKRFALYSLSSIIILWLISFGLAHINWTQPTGKAVTVSLIQGNIAQSVKWNPDNVPNTLNRYYNLTVKNLHHTIIVWPEAAIPVWLSQAERFNKRLTTQLKRTNAVLLTGVPIVNQPLNVIYNGATVLGNGYGHYYKRHLVPFGEYVPLESWLRGIINFFNLPMSTLSAGAYNQPLVNLAGLPTAVAICYEVAFDSEFLHNFPKAKLIVTISDDAWFGRSWASWQQTQISQMRSLETGRYQLVATNNGVTAIIGPKGRLIKTAPRFSIAVLNGTVYDVVGNTPINLIGIAPIIILLLLLLVLLVIMQRYKTKT